MKYHHSKSITNKKFLKIFSVIGLLIIVAGLVGWRFTENWYQNQLKPLHSQAEEVVFEVIQGTSTIEVGDRLQAEGLINSSRAFVWYVSRLENDALIQAGRYSLSAALSTPQIADTLVAGDVETSLVTIPPGLRLDQIRQEMIDSGFLAEDVDKALNSKYTHPLLADKPTKASLEGYIYPETLQITAESTPESVIQRSFDIFYDLLDSSLIEALKQQKLNLHEAVTLASIIQKEVSDSDTQRMVAQVFLKRLSIDMVLGADVTFKYAAAIAGVEPRVDLDSPYNTRINGGLPPGPISNFTISSLEAIANPTKTDYLYFVSGDDGITRFAKTFAEHQSNIDKYCDELCRL